MPRADPACRSIGLGHWALIFALGGGTACPSEKPGPEQRPTAPPGLSGSGGATAGVAGGASGGNSPAEASARQPGAGTSGHARAWAAWPIPNPTSSGLSNPASYGLVRKGVVLDKVTGLVWQRGVDTKPYSWKEAGDYCQQLKLAGHDDWQLPSRIELVSLLDPSRFKPAIDRQAFPRTPGLPFWTASVRDVNPTGAAWNVQFDSGHTKTDPTNDIFHVRCVRVPPSTKPVSPLSAPDYEVRNETVRDRGTVLIWQRIVSGPSVTFDEARLYCAGLRVEEQGGWRVPSMTELLTLVDESTHHPTIDTKAFPSTPSQFFWTSTPFANSASAMAWQINFEYGDALSGPAKEPHRVRCVR